MDDIKVMANRYGFTHYTAAREFINGKTGITPLKSFVRVTQLEPKNPYGWAYLLFAMEDLGEFTINQLLDIANKWHERALEFGYQGQNAFAMIYFTKYMKLKTKMTEMENV